VLATGEPEDAGRLKGAVERLLTGFRRPNEASYVAEILYRAWGWLN
jgi:hypothetical protein